MRKNSLNGPDGNDRFRMDDVEDNKEIPFSQMVQQLPEPIFKRFLKQIVAAVGIAVLTIILLFYTKEAQYCWGFAFALYLAYLALSLVWNCAEEKVICVPMICIKASKITKERMFLILREKDADPLAKNAVHQFYIPASKKDTSLITPNTILNVYYDPRNPVELIAWEIIGIVGDGS